MKELFCQKSFVYICVHTCVYIPVCTYMCTHPLRLRLIVFPSTVPNYTAFALLQHSDSTHFWIFLSPVLDMRQDLYFPTRHDGNIVKAQPCLEYSFCIYAV